MKLYTMDIINVSNFKFDTTEKIILYLIEKLGLKVEGKKKLMKLLFLIEHFNFSSQSLSKNKNVGNDFEIYYYGVYSDKVMSAIRSLVYQKAINDGFPLSINEKVDISLNDNLKEQVDKVIQNFGNKSGYDLEITTLKMLGISPTDKNQYFGRKVSEILK